MLYQMHISEGIHIAQGVLDKQVLVSWSYLL